MIIIKLSYGCIHFFQWSFWRFWITVASLQLGAYTCKSGGGGLIFAIPKEVIVSFYLGLFWNAVWGTEMKRPYSAFWFSITNVLWILRWVNPPHHLGSIYCQAEKTNSYRWESRIGHTVWTNQQLLTPVIFNVLQVTVCMRVYSERPLPY